MHFLMKRTTTAILAFVIALSAAVACQAYDMHLDVKEFTLENGMLFLVVERHTLPQVACRVAIRAGSALEERGKTGIAHLMEHMMFKGTKNFGTIDPDKDQKLQEQIEQAYQDLAVEKQKQQPDQNLIKQKQEEMESLRRQVQEIYVPQAFSSQLGKNGAVGVNAFTSQDQTQYVMSIPSDRLEQWFSIVSEQLFEPAWREFYVEREVVQREWAFRYVNSPMGASWLDLYSTAYVAHPYRNPVIGWKSDLDNLTTNDAIAFHSRFYNPTNAVCVLVGDITVDQAKHFAKVYFERYPAGKRSPAMVTLEPPQEGPRTSIRYLKGARTPMVRVGFHGAPMDTKDFYALDAVTMVMSSGRSARMVQNIVNKGLAVDAWTANPDNRYGGMFIIGGSPHEPEGLNDESISEVERRNRYRTACEALEKILVDEVTKLKTELVAERELDRIKKLNQRDFLESMRSNESLASRLASLEVETGWRYFNTYLKNIAAVTPEDIRVVTDKYIRLENKTSVYILPGGTPDQPPEQYTENRSVSGAAAVKIAKTDTTINHSSYATPEGWKHPLSFERHPEKIDYPEAEVTKVNGATVFYLPDRELPLVELVLLVKAGSVDLPDEKQGLTAVLNGSLIRGGTKHYSPAELAMVLDENAIELSFSASEEESTITLSVLKEDWAQGLNVLQDVLTEPRLDPEIVNVVKQQALVGLQRQSDSAQRVSNRESLIWHFKHHPYGRDPLKEIETIPTVSEADLRAFLRTYFVPSNMVAAVAGDIDKSEVVKGLKRLFKKLPNNTAPERKLEAPAETPPVIALIHKPGQVQSQVSILLPGVVRTNPDYWKLTLLADVLGGTDSLLYKRLREDLGLVYATWFFQTYKWNAGILSGYIGSKGDQTRLALEETVNIMEELPRDVPGDALEQKRLDVLNGFVFNVDTPAALVEVYGNYQLRGEPLDTLGRIQNAYITASKEELEALAQQYLDPKKIQIFVVGDKNTPVATEDGKEITLSDDLKALSQEMGIPFVEIPLR